MKPEQKIINDSIVETIAIGGSANTLYEARVELGIDESRTLEQVAKAIGNGALKPIKINHSQQ